MKLEDSIIDGFYGFCSLDCPQNGLRCVSGDNERCTYCNEWILKRPIVTKNTCKIYVIDDIEIISKGALYGI